MKRFISRYLPEEFFEKGAVRYAFFLGLVYLLLLITQLFTYEDFPAVIRTWSLPGGEVIVGLLVVIVPLCELFSLPFLFSLPMRNQLVTLSQYATLAAAILWLIISLWLTMTGTIAESGFFGATLSLPAGIWMLVYSLLLLAGALTVLYEFRRLGHQRNSLSTQANR